MPTDPDTINSRPAAPRYPTLSISVVIPALNEALEIHETVLRAKQVPEVHEIIVIDGGSHDSTVSIAAEMGCKVVEGPTGRGRQMRCGARLAERDVVLLLHADTWIRPDAGRAIAQCLSKPGVVAGGFWKEFRDPPFLLRGSRPKCAIRVYLGRRLVGDMAMFVPRHVLEAVGGVPDIELMEDFELSRRLRTLGRLALANSVVSTSARRFRENGVLSTYLKMWWITNLYRLGKSPAALRELYR